MYLAENLRKYNIILLMDLNRYLMKNSQLAIIKGKLRTSDRQTHLVKTLIQRQSSSPTQMSG
jgi:hypothetical protein